MEKNNFEAALQRLSSIVTTLEKNEIPLEEAIALFEEGLNLVKTCDIQLKGFETKVQELIKSYGNPES
jgi:exodeoxyribonuclease VII small subunit